MNLKKVLIVAGSMAGLLTFMIAPRFRKMKDLERIKHHPIAHRGLHGKDAEENTLLAFKRARDAGYGIECDVQLTKDKELVIFHDDDLKRMFSDDGFVREKTLKELQSFAFSSGEKIPTFREFLELIDGEVPLVIELKGTSMDQELPRLTYEVLKDYKGHYVIESFNPIYLHWYKKNAPHIVRGQLSGNMLKEKKAPHYLLMSYYLLNFLSRPDFLCHDIQYYKNPSLNALRFLGATTLGYTVKDEETYKERREFDSFIFENFLP